MLNLLGIALIITCLIIGFLKLPYSMPVIFFVFVVVVYLMVKFLGGSNKEDDEKDEDSTITKKIE